MVTIKEYAKSRNISYEAARQTIKRHYDVMSAHIHKHGKTQYIDDDGVEILDSHRISKASPEVYTGKENPADTIDSLKNQIILLQNQIIELQNESREGIEAKTKLQMIEANTGKLEKENQELKAEVNSYQRTFFGLYRKAKKD